MDSIQPSILFVDDEARVLKSMRAMFRKDYNVHLADSGAKALEILAQNDIDVVISDQRMPEMTGVEVLGEIKQRSPKTMRILLTGYADLAAVEASLNDAEVYKYLMKPCSADKIRSTVRDALAERTSKPVDDVHVATKSAPTVSIQSGNSVHLLVLSRDKLLVQGVAQACSGQKLHQADDLEAALRILRDNPVGVLVTDIAVSAKEIAATSTAIRAIVPEVVIVLASDRSDANVLIQLINSGQVFRFLLKPLQIGQCKIWLASALRRFAERGGEALAAFDQVIVKPSAWARFRDWFLGVHG